MPASNTCSFSCSLSVRVLAARASVLPVSMVRSMVPVGTETSVPTSTPRLPLAGTWAGWNEDSDGGAGGGQQQQSSTGAPEPCRSSIGQHAGASQVTAGYISRAMVTDPLPRTARPAQAVRGQRCPAHAGLARAGRVAAVTRALGEALAGEDRAEVRRTGLALLELLARFYRVSTPKLEVLGARPLKVVEGYLSYELFGDYTPSTRDDPGVDADGRAGQGHQPPGPAEHPAARVLPPPGRARR